MEERDLNYLFKKMSTTKPSKKPKTWYSFIIICMLTIFLFTFVIAGLSDLRKSVFISALLSYRNLTNIVQHATQAAFLARKGNVMSFQGADSS